jgi:hypothetical protein
VRACSQLEISGSVHKRVAAQHNLKTTAGFQASGPPTARGRTATVACQPTTDIRNHGPYRRCQKAEGTRGQPGLADDEVRT